MLQINERRLVAAAEAIVRSLPDNDTHTVASAAMDIRGTIHTGVNVFHFTGGPCAELVAIAAAAQALAGPLATIVAVGNRDRGVLAPCGRCRQVLLDLHPDVTVILPNPAGDPIAEPIRNLLPHSYVAPERTDGSRIVYFNPRYYDSVVSGRKTITVRFGEPIQVGSAVFVFEDEHVVRHLSAEIESVESLRFDQLSHEDAHHEDLPNADALRRLLRTHYPNIENHDLVDVARFHSVSA
ncbi:hypothetical protein GCM10022381_22370 [Leifsonia kafniensis]|uniref:CMP/dCMP-type deaminase domain-containing protein n=1 Tax=Leifsonia kafniensis TaxID=475957 RepID=A0ABP7KJD1_9MICO